MAASLGSDLNSPSQFPSFPKILPAALVCLGLVLFFPLAISFASRANDFQTFYDVAWALRQGRNIYAPAASTGMIVYYLPFFSFLILPFTFFSLQTAAILFSYFNVALLFWSSWDALQFFFEGKNKGIGAALLGMILLPYLGMNLGLGQVNLLIGLGIYWAFRFLDQEREILSGMLLAVISFKVIPLFFAALLIFSRKKRWLWAYAATLAALFLLPLLRYSWGEYWDLCRQFYALATHDKTSLLSLTLEPVHSFWGMGARLLQNMGGENPKWVRNGVLVLVSFFLVWSGQKMVRSSQAEWRSKIYLWGSIFTLGMFLFSPDARPAHFSMLFLPIVFLIGRGLKGERWARIFLAAMLLLNLIYSADIVGRKCFEAATHVLLYVWIWLGMGSAFLWLAQRKNVEELP